MNIRSSLNRGIGILLLLFSVFILAGKYLSDEAGRKDEYLSQLDDAVREKEIARMSQIIERDYGVDVIVFLGTVSSVEPRFSDIYPTQKMPFSIVSVDIKDVLHGSYSAPDIKILSWTAIYREHGTNHFFTPASNSPRFVSGDRILIICRGHKKKSRLLRDEQFHGTFLPLTVGYLKQDFAIKGQYLYSQIRSSVDYEALDKLPSEGTYRDLARFYIRTFQTRGERLSNVISHIEHLKP